MSKHDSFWDAFNDPATRFDWRQRIRGRTIRPMSLLDYCRQPERVVSETRMDERQRKLDAEYQAFIESVRKHLGKGAEPVGRNSG